MPENCPEALIQFAERLADAARAVIRPYFRSAVRVEDKPDTTPVTLADREAEEAIRALIGEHHPGHGVVGEEFGSDRSDAEFVWVLDPIDGTKRFITGNPLFGTLIALLRDGAPCLGILDVPILGERWIGASGRPARFRDGTGSCQARCRPCGDLAEATLSASSPHMFSALELPAFERVRQAVKIPLYGGDCYNYGLVASGFADLVIEAGMASYDFAALVPVITSAGGVMTDWTGGPLGLETDGRVIAAGDPGLHAAALELLNSGP